jgi:hypothetical protein
MPLNSPTNPVMIAGNISSLLTDPTSGIQANVYSSGGQNAVAVVIPAGLTIDTRSTSVQLIPTVTAGAYVAGYCVGGILTFTNAFGPAQSGVIETISLTVRSTQTTGWTMYFFDAAITASTFNDHAAAVLSNTTDVQKVVGGAVNLIAYTQFGSSATFYSATSVGIQVSSSSTSLVAVLLTTGTPTFSTTTDVIVTVGILQD